MTITIDKQVPIPPRQRKGGKPPKPDSMVGQIRAMEVGDSFFMPGKTSGNIGGYTKLWRESTGYTFQARNSNEDGKDGVRIWRTA